MSQASLFDTLPRRSRKPATAGFCESTVIAGLADADLLALYSTVGATVADRFLKKRCCLTSFALVIDYLRSKLALQPKEQFRVLFLDKRNQLLSDDVMGDGTVDHVPVYPREVAHRAMNHGATAIVLSHNHPSGDPTPSQADIQMTRQLVDVLKPLGIAVHDHIIIGASGHTSLKASGLM